MEPKTFAASSFIAVVGMEMAMAFAD